MVAKFFQGFFEPNPEHVIFYVENQDKSLGFFFTLVCIFFSIFFKFFGKILILHVGQMVKKL